MCDFNPCLLRHTTLARAGLVVPSRCVRGNLSERSGDPAPFAGQSLGAKRRPRALGGAVSKTLRFSAKTR